MSEEKKSSKLTWLNWVLFGCLVFLVSVIFGGIYYIETLSSK